MNTCISRGDLFDVEYRIRAGDRWVWMRSRGAPRRDAEGTVIRWYGSVECTDERKRAEDDLRVSEARLHAIFDAAPVGLVLVDSISGEVLNANPRAEELIGFPVGPGTVWKSLPWEAFDASGRLLEQSERPLMRAILHQESTRGVEARLCRPDGSTRWLSFSAEPVFLDGGEQLGAVLVIQDIESEKRSNEWLPVREWLPKFVRTRPLVSSGDMPSR
jgi:PAS domain S-box-containing protein